RSWRTSTRRQRPPAGNVRREYNSSNLRPYTGEHRRACPRKAGCKLVIVVEHVVGAHEQRDAVADRPFGSEVDDAVTAHPDPIRGIVVTLRRADDLDAETSRPERPSCRQRAVPP